MTRITAREREMLTGLLGRRPRDASSFSVRMQELDDAFARAGLANDLRHALELIDGPIVDRVAERSEREQAWARAFALPRHPALCALVERNGARGLIKRLARADPQVALELLQAVEHVLTALPAHGKPRSQLAAETLADAHALDSGRPIATIVLACLRTDENERPRDTWATLGILVNELAKPALVLNLPAEPSSAAGCLAEAARALGEPVALSLRVLLRGDPRWCVRERNVFVCENANFLAIAADRLGTRAAPVVCTDGMPSASQRTLLRQLAEQGAQLLYHGDFDWPGLHIANFVIRNFGARPWRFSAHEYNAHRGRRLRGQPVMADWDASLMPAMLAAGYAIDEEAIADDLIADLSMTSLLEYTRDVSL